MLKKNHNRRPCVKVVVFFKVVVKGICLVIKEKTKWKHNKRHVYTVVALAWLARMGHTMNLSLESIKAELTMKYKLLVGDPTESQVPNMLYKCTLARLFFPNRDYSNFKSGSHWEEKEK